MRELRKIRTVLGIAVATGILLGCNNEVGRRSAPVELIATVTQNVQVLDFLNPPATSLGTITIRSIIKDPAQNPSSRFLDVILKNYRVTFERTDGGRLVPASFVRGTSGIITAGSSNSILNNFLVFQEGIFQLAPFAALLPQNGGIDPETGLRTVTMNLIIEIFGETVGGDNVSARTSFPLTFCAGCRAPIPVP